MKLTSSLPLLLPDLGLNKQNLAQEIETETWHPGLKLGRSLNKQNLAQEIETLVDKRVKETLQKLEQTESRSRD